MLGLGLTPFEVVVICLIVGFIIYYVVTDDGAS